MEDSPADYYKYSWELKSYDSCSTTIKSTDFILPFNVTEWHIELDLSKVGNIQCVIPCCLCRHENVGPASVHVNIQVCVATDRESNFAFKISKDKMFNQKNGNFWKFDIEIPREELEKEWVVSKELFITVEMRPKRTDYYDIQEYWSETEDKILLSKDLAKMYEANICHDLVLKVSGDQEFKLHKCILESRWPYFMSKFNIDKSVSYLDLSDCKDLKASTLKLIFPFLYSGDTRFLRDLNDDEKWNDYIKLATDYNLYRLRDKLWSLATTCDSSQLLQSYRIAFKMTLKSTGDDKAMGEYRAIEVPLRSADEKVLHIKFMDVRLYIEKEVNGYNWLLLSIVLGRLPKNPPVTIKYKLYVIDKSDSSLLLTEQTMLFDESTLCTFSLPDIKDYCEKLKQGVKDYESKMKDCHRYYKESEPIITFRELSDQRLNLQHDREELDYKLKKVKKHDREELDYKPKKVKKHDLHFKLELKLSDGESTTNQKKAACFLRHINSIRELSDDMNKLLHDEKYLDYTVIAGPLQMKVHKAILSARSDIFQRFFEAQASRSTGSPIKISKYLLYQFVQYIYSGKIMKEPDYILHHLNTALYYKMDRLYALLKSKRTDDPSELKFPEIISDEPMSL
ncbi:uncharacterized protein TNIN_245781 [Trichonephila inaurata madagascariensis]|uniref:BTB domain-containing protein n=1 Tax=Trichonephila inaurata madagascariensis TaxID=2747483 RepID=A0A8X6YXZ9_9ARAC|nr:uncharacterized protein TNIN_245781 [Trichonephila inaurata madagascariensis]